MTNVQDESRSVVQGEACRGLWLMSESLSQATPEAGLKDKGRCPIPVPTDAHTTPLIHLCTHRNTPLPTHPNADFLLC